MTRRPAVIFDLDNTLADVSYLASYVLGHNTDYERFHQLAVDADPIDWVVWEVKRWSPSNVILVVTARQEKYRPPTEEWLLRHEIPYDELWMRKTGDERQDYDVKSDILLQIGMKYDVKMAYDDRPETVKLWLERGIPTMVIPGWPMGEW